MYHTCIPDFLMMFPACLLSFMVSACMIMYLAVTYVSCYHSRARIARLAFKLFERSMTHLHQVCFLCPSVHTSSWRCIRSVCTQACLTKPRGTLVEVGVDTDVSNEIPIGLPFCAPIGQSEGSNHQAVPSPRRCVARFPVFDFVLRICSSARGGS